MKCKALIVSSDGVFWRRLREEMDVLKIHWQFVEISTWNIGRVLFDLDRPFDVALIDEVFGGDDDPFSVLSEIRKHPTRGTTSVLLVVSNVEVALGLHGAELDTARLGGHAEIRSRDAPSREICLLLKDLASVQ